jgi:hypothetical protein
MVSSGEEEIGWDEGKGREAWGFGEVDTEKEQEKLMEETKRKAEMRIELVEEEIVDKLLIMLRINTK